MRGIFSRSGYESCGPGLSLGTSVGAHLTLFFSAVWVSLLKAREEKIMCGNPEITVGRACVCVRDFYSLQTQRCKRSKRRDDVHLILHSNCTLSYFMLLAAFTSRKNE